MQVNTNRSYLTLSKDEREERLQLGHCRQVLPMSQDSMTPGGQGVQQKPLSLLLSQISLEPQFVQLSFDIDGRVLNESWSEVRQSVNRQRGHLGLLLDGC